MKTPENQKHLARYTVSSKLRQSPVPHRVGRGGGSRWLAAPQGPTLFLRSHVGLRAVGGAKIDEAARWHLMTQEGGTRGKAVRGEETILDVRGGGGRGRWQREMSPQHGLSFDGTRQRKRVQAEPPKNPEDQPPSSRLTLPALADSCHTPLLWHVAPRPSPRLSHH